MTRIAVTPLRAGELRIKAAQLRGRGPVGLRHLRTAISRRWLDPLPIYAWLIDHPDGTLLVDTGPIATPDGAWHTHRYHPYYLLAYRTRVTPADRLDARLEAKGRRASDIDEVVLTHAHPDHVGGIVALDEPAIRIDREELRSVTSRSGRLWGYHPSLIPRTVSVVPVDMGPDPFGPFERSHPLANYPGIRLVPTPGHTAHHASVVVDRGDDVVLLAGDVCYELEQLASGRVDGVATRIRAGRRSLARIRRLCAERPVIVLPSHDPDGPKRLTAGTAFEPGQKG